MGIDDIVLCIIFGYVIGTLILNGLDDNKEIELKFDIIKISTGITSSEKTTMLGKIFLLLLLFISYLMTLPALTLDLILLGMRNIVRNIITLTKPLFIRK